MWNIFLAYNLGRIFFNYSTHISPFIRYLYNYQERFPFFFNKKIELKVMQVDLNINY
jgi:hypothetical protein